MSVTPNLRDVKKSSIPEREFLQPHSDLKAITHSVRVQASKTPRYENTSSNLQKEDEVKNEIIPPDGGWGWLVTFGSFVNMAILGMLITTYGLLYSPMFKEFNVSSTKSSWIFNINQFLWNCSAMLGGPLIAQFGWRKVAMSGGILISMATIMTAYIPNPNYLFFTFSLLTGLGQGIVAVVSLVIVPHYFDSKRGFAIGFTGSGNCVGQFIGPPIVRYLMELYGFSGSMLILGGICLHSIMASSLYHPVEWHAKKIKIKDDILPTIIVDEVSESKDFDAFFNPNSQNGVPKAPSISFELYKELRRRSSISSLRRLSSAFELSSSTYLGNLGAELPKDSSEPNGETTSEGHTGWKKFTHVLGQIAKNIFLYKSFRVQIICLTLSLVISTYINFLMLVPFTLEYDGHSVELVSNSLAVAGICNLVARTIITTLTDFVPFSNKYFFMGGAFGIFVSMNCFTLVSSPTLIYLVMSLFGISAGACCCLTCLMIIEFLGFGYLPQVLGLEGLTISVTFLIFAPVVGGIRDLTQSYALTVRIISLAPLLSFCVWFLMPAAISRDRKRENLEIYCIDD